MHKLSPEKLRGQEAEERFLAIAKEMRKKHLINKVRHASTRQDRFGIDFILFVPPPSGGKDTMVLVQVKSSRSGMKEYFERHPECKEANVVVSIVNDNRTDACIRKALLKRIKKIQNNLEDFRPFFLRLKERAKCKFDHQRHERKDRRSSKKRPRGAAFLIS